MPALTAQAGFDRLKKIQNEKKAEKLKLSGLKLYQSTCVFYNTVGSNES